MTTNNTNTSSNNAASVAHAENIITYKALMMADPYNMTAEAVDKEVEGIDPTMMVMLLERFGVAASAANKALSQGIAAGAEKAAADARAALAKDKHWYNSTTAKVGYGVLGTIAVAAAGAAVYQKVTGTDVFTSVAAFIDGANTAVADTATSVAEAVTA